MISCKTQNAGHNESHNPIASLLCLVITADFPLHLQLNTRMISLWGEDFMYQCPEATLTAFICTSHITQDASPTDGKHKAGKTFIVLYGQCQRRLSTHNSHKKHWKETALLCTPPSIGSYSRQIKCCNCQQKEEWMQIFVNIFAATYRVNLGHTSTFLRFREVTYWHLIEFTGLKNF